MLTRGQSLSSWQVTPLREVEYNVADAPMEGKMDSTFFLTKDKNFIPHTYPCRTAYIGEMRDKEPLPAWQPDWTTARNVLPNGSEFLDLSGFWFRATRLSGWVRSAITAHTAGRARLRLGICGAARLLVNGQSAGWLSPTTRNAMQQAEFDVDLVEGHNDIAVWFEDLAERDAVLRIQITWLDGPAAEQGNPFDADPHTVEAMTATIAAMHLDRKKYDDATITLILPVPFEKPVSGHVTIGGHFMAHGDARYALSIPAGADRVDLCHSADIAPDFRYFHFDFDSAGFRSSAILSAEVSAISALGPAPDTQEARIAEALKWIAENAEPDNAKALACLDLGRAQDLGEAERIFEQTLPTIERCHDCADFALVPMIWARLAYAERMSPAHRDRIDAAMLAYRYWIDEPGNDVQWYFSENHALLFHTCCYLAGHHMPKARFARSGRLGAEQAAVGRERLLAWFDHFEATELAEFNSAPYFPIDLKGFTALFALAPDQDLKDRAARAIVRLVTLMANSAHHGVMTGAQGRSYEHSLCATDTLELSGIARLLWGVSGYGAHVNCLPQLALALRDHGLLIPDLTERACWSAQDAQEWTYQQGENAFCRLYHYKTRDTALGSAARYRWGDWGYQETLIHARLGQNPQAQIWINHPGEMVQCGFGRPSFWGGSANVPRVQQYRDLAIVLFDGEEPQIDFTHAWFPTEAFDDWHIDATRATARAGAGAILLTAARPLVLQQSGGTAGAELRQAGRDGWWIIRMGQTRDLPRFFATHSPQMTRHADGQIDVVDADYGCVTFFADGRVRAEGRELNPAEWTIEGTRHSLSATPD